MQRQLNLHSSWLDVWRSFYHNQSTKWNSSFITISSVSSSFAISLKGLLVPSTRPNRRKIVCRYNLKVCLWCCQLFAYLSHYLIAPTVLNQFSSPCCLTCLPLYTAKKWHTQVRGIDIRAALNDTCIVAPQQFNLEKSERKSQNVQNISPWVSSKFFYPGSSIASIAVKSQLGCSVPEISRSHRILNGPALPAALLFI